MNKTEFQLKVFSLSERLFPMVSRMLGNNANAEDAIQEIMLKLWVKRNEIEQHPNITGFVFLTARNFCIDLLRKKKLEINDSSLQLEILKSEYGQEQLEWKELNIIIRKILKSLPEQQREVIVMRDLDGYEFNEIAAVTQLKIEHIRVLLSRARKQVGLKLEKTYSYERGQI
ncbi:RNA polymerase sigma-70 factor (ECF subfamily) [Saonia flava]|uniref:RNA polymerase sigma-70 factor (ECF subfamily) n=1 Tax=Saonia flava TaxID=523696 RepID=A0A846QYP3_9FLAO|nr:RNA polymerase sigma factor [Saonia flava]NJB72327.1 RNA polymerase sigma-70 factor (ECF subfamily) [Saonia flava]